MSGCAPNDGPDAGFYLYDRDIGQGTRQYNRIPITGQNPRNDCLGPVLGQENSTNCASCGCANATGPSVMKMVGDGQGEYIVTKSYKYVGKGLGDSTMEVPKIVPWNRILGAILALAAITAAVLLLWPTDTPTTSQLQQLNPDQLPTVETTQAPPTPSGVCEFWGDPHLTTFDKGKPSFYGEGEQWIVKSADVHIQGRYLGTVYTKGLAATDKIAVGGPFLKGHTIIVGSLQDGPITVDKVPVLQTLGSTHTLFRGAKISYTSTGNLVDSATNIWTKHVVHMELPLGVRIMVFRWQNYMDLRIEMPEIPGMDGACGNFNGDPSDDTTAKIFERVGPRVHTADLLFAGRTPVHFTAVEDKLLKICPPDRFQRGQKDCSNTLGPSVTPNQRNACLLDICFGNNEHALRMAKALGL